MGKEEDRCELDTRSLSSGWLSSWRYPAGSFGVGLELWRNVRISNICLEFKLIEIIAEPGEWMGQSRERIDRGLEE